ncbi:MAG TPA: SET domain-containing protein [Myxococcota bacterium]|nr:SET domain-containing protein [Myxococcota bacterium]
MLLVKTRIGPSQIDGIGLFADEFIPKGTPVWKLVRDFDIILTPEQIASLSDAAREQFIHYGHLDIFTGEHVLCADNARFLNHSDDPNVCCYLLPTPNDEDLDVAVRDIEKGEELTINYKEYDGNWPLKLGAARD